MPRPSKLTPEVTDKIVAAIRAGNYAHVAADYAGISEPTFYRWLQKGKTETQGKFHDLYVAVRHAESEAEVRAVAIIQSHMADNWQAAMAYLSRRYPSRWGLRQHLALDLNPREELAKLLAVEPEEIDELVEEVARLYPGSDEVQ